MGQCYNCRYFRRGEGKCGYNGNYHSSSDSCGSTEYVGDSRSVCGNCRHYDVNGRYCTLGGYSHQPYDDCGMASHCRA